MREPEAAPGSASVRSPDASSARAWLSSHHSHASEKSQVELALSRQRPDGSWGERDGPTQRILPTLWMAKVLVELDRPHDPAVQSAGRFLARHASTDNRVFSIDGQRSGVLSCYVGIATTLYTALGLDKEAQAQVGWILRYQDVCTRGTSRRKTPVDIWSHDLEWRYGGCLAHTSCLIGLAKTGLGLVAWRDNTGSAAGDTLLAQICEALLERELFRASTGEVLPLGTMPTRPQEWLLPTFPLDWRVDLIEMVHLVSHVAGCDARMQPALAVLAEQQLDDGSWPLRRAFRPRHLPLLERRSRTRGSVYVTRRVVRALGSQGL